MPLGIVNKDFFDSLPKKGDNKPPKEKGRGEGKKETPEEVRKLLSELSIEGTSAKELMQISGLSQSSISAYKSGKTSTAAPRTDKDLKAHVNKVKERIGRKARRVLIGSLDSIDDVKLQNLNAVDAAHVARQMSAIVREMEPQEDHGHHNDNRVQVVIYAPPIQTENQFDAIDVSAIDS